MFAYIKNFLEANLSATPLLIKTIISPFEILLLIDEAGHSFFLAKYEVCTNGVFGKLQMDILIFIMLNLGQPFI